MAGTSAVNKIKGLVNKIKEPLITEQLAEPLWKGPTSSHELGGITFSMLSRFLTCRSRFRVRFMDGLRPIDKFNHRIEYGNMWHVCEEAHAAGHDWLSPLKNYAEQLGLKYRFQQEEIDKWYQVCKVQFPVYVAYWSKHEDVKARVPVMQEQVFDVPYTLPDGKTVVRLRGKFDSVDSIGGKLYIQENKTKGDIDEDAIKRQLTFDLQTMMYVVALKQFGGNTETVGGVRYNVVRRPLSGGKGTIVQKKGSKNVPAETKDQYYARLKGYIDGTGDSKSEDGVPGPSYYFMRWDFDVSEDDINIFRETCLDPILENLCWWYDCVTGCRHTGIDPMEVSPHWRHPYGCTNTIDEYGISELDAYLNDGNTVGLERVNTLFPELQESK